MKMPIFPDASVYALLGYGVVFVGLILLMAVVILAGKAMTAKKAAPAAASAAESPTAAAAPAKDGPAAPGSAGQIALHDVSDKDAAMIMAIVADELGKPINELRFKSIKEVK